MFPRFCENLSEERTETYYIHNANKNIGLGQFLTTACSDETSLKICVEKLEIESKQQIPRNRQAIPA